MLVVLHISIQRTSIFKKLLLAYGEDINIFVFDSKAPNWDNFQAFLDGEVRYLSLKKVCPNEAQELFDAAKKAAQHRYATYVRMSKITYISSSQRMPFHDGSASFFIPRVIILHPFPINFYHTSVYVLQCCSVASRPTNLQVVCWGV